MAKSDALVDPPSIDLVAATSSVDPDVFWAPARVDQPVFFSEEHNCWLVTRYADARRLLTDSDAFSSCSAFTSHMELPDAVLDVLGERKFMEGNPINFDPPVHTPIRRIWGRALLRRQVDELEPMVRGIADQLVDGFAKEGRLELMSGFASPFPAIVVICGLLSVPLEDIPMHVHWGQAVAILLGADAPVEALVEAAQAHVEHRKYWESQIDDRRRNPRDDLLTAIVEECEAEPDVELDTEALAYLPLGLSAAGHVTTAQAIAFGTLLLLEHPDQRALALGDPATMTTAVDEILRIESPVQMVRRTTRRAVEIAGVEIPAGADVMAVTGSANHDPEAFDGDPAQFDVCRRDAAEHLSFSRGVHFCLGAALARREIGIALEVLFTRLPGLRLADEQVERFHHSFHRGFERVEVQWDSESATTNDERQERT